MLTIRNLTKRYENTVLEGFSYRFPDHGLFLIRGESGVGKTTLLRLIAGLEQPDSGEVEYPQNTKISVVFQEPRLLGHLNVLDNVTVVQEKKDPEEARRILAELDLADETKKRPFELSGGMRLRVAIARSVAYGGQIYLWDEPTKELDPKRREKVIELMQRLSQSALVIAVSHEKMPFDCEVIEIKKKP